MKKILLGCHLISEEDLRKRIIDKIPKDLYSDIIQRIRADLDASLLKRTKKCKKDEAEFQLLKEAARAFRLGFSESQIRPMITFSSGGVYQHHIDAVCLKLHSNSHAFNDGRSARLERKKKICPYYAYTDQVYWHTGYDATDLAIRLHGKKRVLASL